MYIPPRIKKNVIKQTKIIQISAVEKKKATLIEQRILHQFTKHPQQMLRSIDIRGRWWLITWWIILWHQFPGQNLHIKYENTGYENFITSSIIQSVQNLKFKYEISNTNEIFSYIALL